jgi:hypothetical protein
MALLGSPRVLLGSEPVTGFRTSKGRALLFYLALSGRVQQRARLTALFWPEADEVHARASLRTALADLRTLLGEHLAITRETVALRPDGLWLDVAQFDALLRRTGDAQTDIMQLEPRSHCTGETSSRASIRRTPRSSSSGRPSSGNGCARRCSTASWRWPSGTWLKETLPPASRT